MNRQLLQQARVLDINEQTEPVEAISDCIVRGAAPSLTDAQKTELDRRRQCPIRSGHRRVLPVADQQPEPGARR